MKPLNREDLDKSMCSLCGAGDLDHEHALDEPLFVHGLCHPQANMVVSYISGVVTVACALCGKLVVKISVASSTGIAS